jgi:Rho-binding antiterminator
MAPYQPIACEQHERLEFAVLRRIPLWLRYQDASGADVAAKIMPLDVATRDAAEWLNVRFEDGHCEVLRLDWLLEIAEQPLAGASPASN